MGTHERVLSESYPLNTNMTGKLYGFQRSLHPCALDESSLRSVNYLPPLGSVVHPMQKKAKNYENHLIPVMLVFIEKLSLSTFG